MVWQALLRNARTGERLAFPSLAECLAHLDQTYTTGQRPVSMEEIAQGEERDGNVKDVAHCADRDGVQCIGPGRGAEAERDQ